MRTLCFHLFAVTLLSIVPAVSAQSAKKPSKEPAPGKEKPEETRASGNDMLKSAVTTMSNLTSYHAAGTFSAGKAKATISGDFAIGAVDMQVLGFDGKIAFRRAVKDKFYVSHDSGKSWQEDDTVDMTALLSLAVTSPLNAANKLWEQGEFKVLGGEKLEEEEVLHLQKPAKGEEPAMDFWLAKDAKLGLIIRKASFVISADDGDFPVVMAYTALNEPVKITAPATGGEQEKKEK